MKFALTLALGAGLLFAGAASAAIAPPVPAGHTQIIQVRDGCGRGWHRNHRGECRPNRDRFEDGDSHGDWHGDWHGGWGGCGRHYHRNRWGRCVPNW